MADQISKLLDSYHANTLREIAQAGGLVLTDHKGKRLGKREMIRKMQAEFFAPIRVSASLARLSGRERAVLNRLQLRGGTAPTKGLRREVLRAGLVTVAEEQVARAYPHRDDPYARGYAGQPTKPQSTEFVDVLARLTYHGLVFSQDAPLGSGAVAYKLRYHPGATVFIPQEIQRCLPKPEPIQVDIPDWQPDQVRAADPALLLRDLYLYWDFVRRNEVPLLQSGLVGKRSLKAINETLLVVDPSLQEARREDETERLYLLRLLLEKLELVHCHRGQVRLTNQDALHISQFWAWSETQQIKTCLDAWASLGATTRQEQDIRQHNPRFTHARKTVLASLQSLPPSAWFEPEDILENIQDQDPDFLFGDHSRVENSPYHWYNSYSGRYYYGSTRELLKEFELAENNFVQDCVTGFLHQVGLADLGSVGGRWNAFCLTPTGKAVLDATNGPAEYQAIEQETGKVIVQPSFQVIAIGPVNLGWLARLDQFAERERADRGAFEYRLSRDSIYQAQQLGMDVPEVLHFLEGFNGGELPQNVRRSLEEWGAYHERIVFRTGASLLQAADESLLVQLTESPQTGKYLARPLSPKVALLTKGGLEHLVPELLAQGFLPAVSGDQPESVDDSVIVHEDGTIQPIHAVPSLHLRGRLPQVAEATSDAVWRLTAASVRKSGGSKKKVLLLLDELEKLHRGTLPTKLTMQIKAWGGYYGDAAAETLTLVEFRDQETLDELRSEPDLQPYLIPFPAGNRALAQVPSDQLAEVRRILARLGVHLGKGL